MARQLTLLPNIGSWRISRQHKDAARRGIAACRAALAATTPGGHDAQEEASVR